MRRLAAIIFFFTISLFAEAQTVDTNSLKSLYDRCLDFSEEKLDSLHHYADYILEQSKKIGFVKGDVLSLRLKGIHQELSNDYSKAIDFYLQSLDAARKINGAEYESAALSDLAIVYAKTHQPDKAKEVYLQSLALSKKSGEISGLVTSYINLGVIYNQLNLQDSALYFLQEGLHIGKPYESQLDLSTLYNNLGDVYFRKKQYSVALKYFNQNKARHVVDNNTADLWVDYLNIGHVYLELKKYDSAKWYADTALQIAKELSSRSKEADSYALMAKYHAAKGDYEKAFQFQEKWYTIDTSLVNNETNSTIAALQEQYNAQKREQDYKLLKAVADQSDLQKRIITLIAMAVAIIAILIGISLVQKRVANKKLEEKNSLITRQNEKLAELNYEKNSLISIVSHDLASPFAAIKMWSNILKDGQENFDADQKKAVDRISSATLKGEEMIHNILDVEKAETNQHKLDLQQFDLKVFVENIINDFKPAANGKKIDLHFETLQNHVFIVSDKHLVTRICENLLSNALKYTAPGKNVWVSLANENDAVRIQFKDEGVGIDADELPHLFSKYSKISSKPTAGEASTGLGLSIVKRIVQELNGTVFCESEPGRGSLFTVILKK